MTNLYHKTRISYENSDKTPLYCLGNCYRLGFYCLHKNSTKATTPSATKSKSKKISEDPHEVEVKTTKAYQSAMRKVGTAVKQDMNYQKLDLSTQELKDWFTDITLKVWGHQITKEQFVALGLEKFPRHSYEFNQIAEGLLQN